MKKKILIVEDQFIEANNLQMILEKAGYHICGIARSVVIALEFIEKEKPDLVLLDILLQGNLTGIHLAWKLKEKNIGFVFLSANSNQQTLDEAKVTRPYGFLVKPFREKDILVTLDIAWYLYEQDHLSKKIQLAVHHQQHDLSSIAAFKGIIGRGEAITKLLDTVLVVATADTSVLLLGESGTGKGKIAGCIHTLSSRQHKPLVKVNCAALPATLIESELFGHERGAFTGAYEKRIGKFEQASGGTIFLDEIGDMPLETQAKLLRVLQEKEIERIGGRETIKINVRIIAATNRELEKEVAEGRFRMDLYYRLNVFPLVLPPLRERKEDLPQLARYFLQQYSTKTGKTVNAIATGAMEKLMQYQWPGNIRELENIIERTVLLTNGTTITDFSLPVITPNRPDITARSNTIKTMDENERDHIIAALQKCNGKVSGEGGAAELLKIPASTLNSRMKKLGIVKEHYFTIEKR